MRAALLIVSVTMAAACGHRESPAAQAPAPEATTPASAPSISQDQAGMKPVLIEMKNVRLHAADGIVLDIATLKGEMVSRTPGRAPIFDDQNSYTPSGGLKTYMPDSADLKTHRRVP